MVAAMEAAGVRRLVYLSFIGVSASRRTAGPLIRNVVSRIVRNEVADHELKEEIVAGSSLDWTIVRPPLLTGGPPTGGYRCGEGISPSGAVPRLSRADVAGFMVRQLTDTAFVRRAPSLVP